MIAAQLNVSALHTYMYVHISNIGLLVKFDAAGSVYATAASLLL